jgi:hypothetical protein
MNLILKPKQLKYTAKDFIDSGIDEEVAIAFMAHRKAKKQTCSTYAINAIAREAKKAGMTLEQALITIMENDWKGLKAEWIKNQQVSFIQQHTDKSWRDGTGFVDRVTDRSWANIGE